MYVCVDIEKLTNELENYIQTQTQTVMAKSQREYFLREQIKVIQKELRNPDPTYGEELRIAYQQYQKLGFRQYFKNFL